MGAPTAIRLRGVTKRFAGSSTDAVSDLSLELPEGSLTALVGPSGCGKTTTLRMINRLEEPTSGTIELFGNDIRKAPLHELRRGIGYVIQQAGLFPHRTIAANIATVPKLLGWDKARIRARVDELVDLVGLDPSLLRRYPAALSGGQQQRVGVARALAADPPVLLMDEPYSAVDPIVRLRLQDELISLQRRVRKTIVFVTHDIDEAIKLADRVALLDVGGVLAQFGPPDELLRAPASAFVEAFLGNERALRRLALRRVADATLDPLPSDLDGFPTISHHAGLREALDALVAQGVTTVIVTDDAGAAIGALDVIQIAKTMHREHQTRE
jgi:osmoprotectant transport system ATP-binding protein